MSELLPDNLELARRLVDSCMAMPCATVKSPKKRELLERVNYLVGVLQHIHGNHCQEVPGQISRATSLPLYRSRGGVAIQLRRMAQL